MGHLCGADARAACQGSVRTGRSGLVNQGGFCLSFWWIVIGRAELKQVYTQSPGLIAGAEGLNAVIVGKCDCDETATYMMKQFSKIISISPGGSLSSAGS